MAGEPFDIKFTGDPSDAVQAAKQVAAETNKIASAEGNRDTIISGINAKLKTMAKAAAVAAIAVAGIGANTLRKRIKEYEELSRAIEVSYEKAQELAIAERDAKLETNAIRSAIEGLAKAQAGYSPELRRLGFTIAEIQGLKPDELFDALSKKLNEGGLSARQFDAAINVLGKDGGEVALSLAGGFEEFREIARDSGKIISEETFGKLISNSDTLMAQLQLMGEDIIKLATPFETFGELASAAIGKVTKTITDLKGGVSYLVNFYGGLLGGLSSDEASDFAAVETAEGAESDAARTKERVDAKNRQRSARESLGREQRSGTADILKRLEQSFSGGGDFGELQKVGLAAGRGQSEALKLARQQNGKLQTLIKETSKQTAKIDEKF